MCTAYPRTVGSNPTFSAIVVSHGLSPMAKTVPVRDDFEPLFYDEIGRLVVAAGRVEYVLKLCLKQLVGKGFNAGILEAEEVRHLAPLCDEVERHAKSKLNGDQQKIFCAVIDTIRLLADERNERCPCTLDYDGLARTPSGSASTHGKKGLQIGGLVQDQGREPG